MRENNEIGDRHGTKDGWLKVKFKAGGACPLFRCESLSFPVRHPEQSEAKGFAFLTG
jgi:hypothetical protein